MRNNPLLMDAPYLSKIDVNKEGGLCDMPNAEKRQMDWEACNADSIRKRKVQQ